MRKFAFVSALGAALTILGAANVGANERAAAPLGKLVKDCRVEAVRGHLRHFSTQRVVIEAHKARMTRLCGDWTSPVSDKSDLLNRCRAEAANGARHVHRGGNYDRSHMMKLQRLCDDLAIAAGAGPLPKGL